jgi:DNA-binding YbaB/EbfC family protein
MADFMKILQQAQEMTGRMQEMQDKLLDQTVTGSAGGGVVKVETDGKGQLRSVKIDPSVVNADDVTMLEDLVVVAVREAQKKASELEAKEASALTGGMNLPFPLPF